MLAAIRCSFDILTATVRLLTPIHSLLDLFYPRVCAVCEQTGDSSAELCAACTEQLEKLEWASNCDKCAMPVAEHGAACPWCSGEGTRPFDRIVRLGVYKEPIRHLIHQIKYHNRWNLAELLAERLAAQDSVQQLLHTSDLLIPVPLHPFRHMSRGYNQADVVAKRLGKLCNRKVSHPLVRLKNTETQTHLHAKDKRFENLKDAFGVLSPGAVRGKRVILVDDVMTTGATLVSAARTLLEAEPVSISAIVISVADPRGQDFEAI